MTFGILEDSCVAKDRARSCSSAAGGSSFVDTATTATNVVVRPGSVYEVKYSSSSCSNSSLNKEEEKAGVSNNKRIKDEETALKSVACSVSGVKQQQSTSSLDNSTLALDAKQKEQSKLEYNRNKNKITSLMGGRNNNNNLTSPPSNNSGSSSALRDDLIAWKIRQGNCSAHEIEQQLPLPLSSQQTPAVSTWSTSSLNTSNNPSPPPAENTNKYDDDDDDLPSLMSMDSSSFHDGTSVSPVQHKRNQRKQRKQNPRKKQISMSHNNHTVTTNNDFFEEGPPELIPFSTEGTTDSLLTTISEPDLLSFTTTTTVHEDASAGDATASMNASQGNRSLQQWEDIPEELLNASVGLPVVQPQPDEWEDIPAELLTASVGLPVGHFPSSNEPLPPQPEDQLLPVPEFVLRTSSQSSGEGTMMKTGCEAAGGHPNDLQSSSSVHDRVQAKLAAAAAESGGIVPGAYRRYNRFSEFARRQFQQRQQQQQQPNADGAHEQQQQEESKLGPSLLDIGEEEEEHPNEAFENETQSSLYKDEDETQRALKKKKESDKLTSSSSSKLDLVEAVAVDEEKECLDYIPNAFDWDVEEAAMARHNLKQKMNQSPRARRIRLFGSLALYCVTLLIVAVSVTVSSSKQYAAATAATETVLPLGFQGMIPAIKNRMDNNNDDSSNTLSGDLYSSSFGAMMNPYEKAFKWILMEDPLQLTFDTSSNLFQRYIAAYFYFAMTTNGPMLSCNPPFPPLSSSSTLPLAAANPKSLESSTNSSAASIDDSTICTFKYLIAPETYSTSSSHAWLSRAHECDWPGIRCDSQQQIIHITLEGQNLTGSFPEGILYLPFLTSLDLGVNSLTGNVPPQLFSSLRHISKLWLYENTMSGPLLELTTPKESKKMRDFNLGRNFFSGTMSSEMSHYLVDMKSFRLFENNVTGPIPTEIGAMDSLTYFNMANNDLTGPLPESMSHWSLIEEIYFDNNELTGPIPAFLGQLNESLEDLSLRGNHFTGPIPEEIYQLTVLSVLDLSNNKLTGTVSSSIGNFKLHLSSLVLNNNDLRGTIPSEISLLPYVANAYLFANNFNGTMPQAFCDLKGIQALQNVQADCTPDPLTGLAEIQCSSKCCNVCCGADGGDCLNQQA